MLWLKRLQDSDNFTVLPRAAALLLVSEVKPAENGTKCPHLEKGVTLWNHRSTRAPFKTLGTIPLPQTGPIYVGLHLHCLIQGGRKPQKRSSVSLKRGPSSLASGERGSGKWSFHLHEERRTDKFPPVKITAFPSQARPDAFWFHSFSICTPLHRALLLRCPLLCFPSHSMFSLCLSQPTRSAPPCWHLRVKVLQGLEAQPCSLQQLHCEVFPGFPLSLNFFLSSGITAGRARGRGGWRGCDGDWRAEPQSLPSSEGSQSGPTLPQHPLRLAIQAVWTAQGQQWERRGQLNFNFVL